MPQEKHGVHDKISEPSEPRAASNTRQHATFSLEIPPTTVTFEVFFKSFGPEPESDLRPMNRDKPSIDVRYVVPPVSDLTVFIPEDQPSGLPHDKPENVKANQRWWVELQFNSHTDISILRKSLIGAGIRLVEMKTRFYLEDPAVPDTATATSVHQYAKEALSRLNATVSILCPHYVPPRILSLVEIYTEGLGRSFVSATMTRHGRRELASIEGFLSADRTELPAIVSLSSQNKHVAEALFYFGSEGSTWANLYKVCEVIEENLGGKSRLFHNEWCSRSNWSRFRHTANYHGRLSRHASLMRPSPKKPMSEAAARSFVRDLLIRWIREILKSQAPS